MRGLMKWGCAILLLAGPLCWAETSPATTPGGYLRVVGSSTAAPFMAEVADRLGFVDPDATPVVEVTGTGAGLSLLCQSSGHDLILATASRPITDHERTICRRQGHQRLYHHVLGLDGLVLLTPRRLTSRVPTNITPHELFLALAAAVPNPDNPATTLKNPYTTWRAINKKFPDVPIVLYGPPAHSGLQEALLHLVLKPYCPHPSCWHVRQDSHYIEMPENSTLMLEKIRQDSYAIGLSSFRLYDQNRKQFRALRINGVAPTAQTIREKIYPLARKLYIYWVANTHPALKQFITVVRSQELSGHKGVFEELGLVLSGSTSN